MPSLFFFGNSFTDFISLHEQCVIVVGLVRTYFRAQEARPDVVHQELFGGLAVFLVHGQEKHREHHRHHAERCAGITCGVPQDEKQRHTYGCRCAETDKLPCGQVKGDFGLHLGQVARHRDICSQIFIPLSVSAQNAFGYGAGFE